MERVFDRFLEAERERVGKKFRFNDYYSDFSFYGFLSLHMPSVLKWLEPSSIDGQLKRLGQLWEKSRPVEMDHMRYFQISKLRGGEIVIYLLESHKKGAMYEGSIYYRGTISYSSNILETWASNSWLESYRFGDR